MRSIEALIFSHVHRNFKWLNQLFVSFTTEKEKVSRASVLAFVIGWRANGWGSRRHRAVSYWSSTVLAEVGSKTLFRKWNPSLGRRDDKRDREIFVLAIVFVQLVNQRCSHWFRVVYIGLCIFFKPNLHNLRLFWSLSLIIVASFCRCCCFVDYCVFNGS